MTTPNKQILCSRRAAAERLGCSVDTVKRLECFGRLTPVKLTGPHGQVFLRVAEIDALAQTEAA